MAAAPRAVYKTWIIAALTALGPSRVSVVYDWIEANCPVPAKDLATLTPDGESVFRKETRFARWDLRRGGIIDPQAPRGIWALR